MSLCATVTMALMRLEADKVFIMLKPWGGVFLGLIKIHAIGSLSHSLPPSCYLKGSGGGTQIQTKVHIQIMCPQPLPQ